MGEVVNMRMLGKLTEMVVLVDRPLVTYDEKKRQSYTSHYKRLCMDY